MTTIIIGTNRPGSRTAQVGKYYQSILEQLNIPHQTLSLEHHNVLSRDEAFVKMETEFLINSSHIIVIAPEYNGGMPGILKLMIDNTDVRIVWPDKKIALVGVATGRAGNLRGLDQLQAVFSHMKARVYYGTLPISSVHKLYDEHGILTDSATMSAIENQINLFHQF